MKHTKTWMRRGMCLAVCLVAVGLYGCKAESTDQDVPAEEDAENVPEADDFQHAFVLASDDAPVLTSSFRQTMNLQSSASASSSSGWTPQQFLDAYNVDSVVTAGNKPRGYGIKIAIITAYHYSNLQSDLNTWARKFSINPISLNIINQAGTVRNSNWAIQSNIAVQMVNAVSPGATVYVIEAKSNTQSDMRIAVQTAVNLGVDIVSMPFGAREFSGENSMASMFAKTQIAWIVAAGTGAGPTFPGTSPDVVAVGSTSASLSASSVLLSETAVANSAAGMSIYQRMPSYQMIPAVQNANTTAFRSVPDVAFHADSGHGAQIYVSILGGWYVIGGNAVSTAFFTGVVAIADQVRKGGTKPMLSTIHTSPNPLQRSLYGLMSTNGGPTNSTVLNDVVDGYSGEGSYPAGPGYDIATGLGSLDVKAFVDYMYNQ
ncbi:hypothetical protein [Halopseudomonas pelagia]|uniref:Peptidase S53 domain-containing protein n=1 Tax=Halopseudomonas pelagia TaxID=553151 RepID=A0AA91Z552_9GAMM|nr:hypothetical protein [Halopseudomonas pelagia]PCC98284.1 hypothetical protein CO192_15965 [Halopseudomonas pelagia]QFY56701.1 hypothetical protein EAO82_10150 [Halopseudomonas pelagia]